MSRRHPGTEGPRRTKRWRRDKLCLLEPGCVSSPALGHRGSCTSHLRTPGLSRGPHHRVFSPLASDHITALAPLVRCLQRTGCKAGLLASRSMRAHFYNNSGISASVSSPITHWFFFSGDRRWIPCLLHLLENKTQPHQFEDLLGFMKQFMDLAKSHPASTRVL